MYEDTTIAETPLYELYREQLNNFTNKRYFTISPSFSGFTSLESCITEWKGRIRDALYNTCIDYVYTLELAGGIRPHFHGIVDLKDYIGFTKKMFLLARYDNVKIHTAFKKGDEYIFKECDITYRLTNMIPIIEKEDDFQYKAEMQRKRKQAQTDKRIELLQDKPIPRWMLNDSDDTESV